MPQGRKKYQQEHISESWRIASGRIAGERCVFIRLQPAAAGFQTLDMSFPAYARPSYGVESIRKDLVLWLWQQGFMGVGLIC